MLTCCRYVPCSEPVEAGQECRHVTFEWPQGDKTVISVDMSSLNPESTGNDCMSLYKYLVLLEKQKRVTSYDMSYSSCKRSTTAGNDAFEVEIKNGHHFKTIADTTKALTCKSFFHDCFTAVKASEACQTVFRFRFDRVHACTKVQRPYVYTSVAIEVEANQPLQL